MSTKIEVDPSIIDFECDTEVILKNDIKEELIDSGYRHQEVNEKINKVKSEFVLCPSDNLDISITFGDDVDAIENDVFIVPSTRLDDNFSGTNNDIKEVRLKKLDGEISSNVCDNSERILESNDNIDVFINNNMALKKPTVLLTRLDLSKIKTTKSVISNQNLIKKKNIRNLKDIMKKNIKKLNDEQLSCDVCGKIFSRKWNLDIHVNIHNNTQPFNCNICDKGFNQSSHLREHKLTHSKDKPLSCNICKKQFVSTYNLMRHKNIHNNIKSFICNTCGRSFNQSSILKKHEMTHSRNCQFVCEICGRTFIQSHSLYRHQMVHSSIKPYVCKICKKGFNRLSSLDVHELIHMEKKPFTCDMCGKSSRSKEGIRMHIVNAWCKVSRSGKGKASRQ